MVLYRLPGEGCADTPAKRRKSFHGGSTMASMPSTSAAVSTPEYSKEEFLSSICGFIHYLVKPYADLINPDASFYRTVLSVFLHEVENNPFCCNEL